MDISVQILTFLYSIAGIVGFFGFVPTILDLIRGNPSANIGTYSVWSIITTFSLLYGVFVLRDVMFILVIGSQLFGYLIILILRVSLEYRK